MVCQTAIPARVTRAHSLVPLIHRMVVHESGLNLDRPQEGLLGEGPVIHAKRDDGLLGRYITVGHKI